MKIFHSEEEASRDTHANGVAAARVISYPPVVPGVRWDFSVLCSLCCPLLCNFDIACLESPFVFSTVEEQ